MIKIRRGDLTIEVDSESEFAAVLRSLPPGQGVIADHISPSEDGSRNARRYSKLVRRLQGGRHWPIIEALAASDKGLTDTEFRAVRKLDEKMALGGSLSGISKLAKAYKLDRRDVLRRERLLDTPGSKYRFSLAPELRDFLLASGTR